MAMALERHRHFFSETSRSYRFETLSPAAANVSIHWEKINSAFKVEAELAKPPHLAKDRLTKKNRQDLQIHLSLRRILHP